MKLVTLRYCEKCDSFKYPGVLPALKPCTNSTCSICGRQLHIKTIDIEEV